MKSWDVASLLSLFFSCLWCTSQGVSASSFRSGPKPNVIFVLTDDQGYGDLACHGNPVIKTPNLDRLHSESVRFTNFHVAPCCSPTRAGLLTGRYPSRVGVWHTVLGRSLLRKGEVTLADVFRASGYRTGIFGKWHLGDNYPFRPQDRGFEHALIHLGGGIGNAPDYWGNDYFDDTYLENGKPKTFKGYCTDVWFEEALKFIGRNREHPFFCYIPTNAPHGPLFVEERYSKPYSDGGVDSSLAKFYGMIANIDENVGRLRERLRAMGLDENTIVIFMTDNGTATGRRGFNAGMRGSKGSAYDGGHRVPFFVHWPAGGLTGGRDVDRLTAHVDLMPTLIDLCGLRQTPAVEFDGRSLVPLLRGGEVEWPDRILVTDNQRVIDPIKWRRSAVMTETWRLVDGRVLYDIRKDPGQEHDVGAEHPDVVARLRAGFDRWWESVYEHSDEDCEIIIGSDMENPSKLTSHDLFGACVWNQEQIRGAKNCDGYWAIEVARDGKYEFSLRRWPREFDMPITATLPGGRVVKATSARLKVAHHDIRKPVRDGDREVTFDVELKAGSTRLQAWFMDGTNDGRTHGVYYVYAKRL